MKMVELTWNDPAPCLLYTSVDEVVMLYNVVPSVHNNYESVMSVSYTHLDVYKRQPM